MAVLYKTSFHRFNTIANSSGVTNASSLIGTGLGTASLLDTGDYVRLSDPTVIDDSGTTQTFSTEIANSGHTNYTIKGIQIQTQISSSLLTFNFDMQHKIRLNGSSDVIMSTENPLSLQPYNPRLYPDPTQPLSTFTLDLNTNNIDDLELTTYYSEPSDQGDWFSLSNTFASGTPTPAIRIWYEGYSRITVTTGKLSITSGKVSIGY